ncbi:Permease of the drug/metabolite transporter (DMT) superfamily [Phyllobacterium sp. YR620]|uniref:DMT family transporter n=1 Tax=Phyllobacterium sp. YR620 TaxID=1881066 RepID=UPI0008880645|nr:DMT family transporter [Phyllobacterium sp. YR620]SDP01176.1 Permease of the drug/metabolite transporter (DMT) superfamily [Phyllobacterium sp. YR620]
MALSPNLRGAIYMAIGMASFTFNDATVKYVGEHMNMGQVMLVRGSIATVLILALAWHKGMLIPLREALHRMTIVRVIGEVVGTVSFLVALVHVPLALTSAILQALPLAVTMGAAIFFGEPVGWRRWVAIAVGFCGVLITVRPGGEGVSPYILLIVVTVIFAALRDLATRKVPKTIPVLMISALTSIGVSLAGVAMIGPLGGWKPMSLMNTMLLTLAACCVIVAYHFLILAMREGEISFIAPFRYTSLLWAILLGFLFFDDLPDVPMIVGSLIVIGSGLYTLYREQIVGRMKPVEIAAAAARTSPDGV